MLVKRKGDKQDSIDRRLKEVQRLEASTVVLKAAKKVEKAWRSRSSVPTCPHCHEAIFPEDGFGGTQVNKKMAIERRKFKDKQ